MNCAFCGRVAAGDLTVTRGGAAAFPDAHPLTQGHMLVVPRRHVPSIFDLAPEELAAVWALVADVRELLTRGQGGEVAFNVGVNDGAPAGQTVAHAHVHVIPRHAGDVEDPRGGIRGMMPGRARYWNE